MYVKNLKDCGRRLCKFYRPKRLGGEIKPGYINVRKIISGNLQE